MSKEIDISKIVHSIKKSKKYRYINEATILRVVQDLSTKYPEKKLDKEVRRKLHQLWGAYFSRPDFEKLLKSIRSQYEEGLSTKDIFEELFSLQTSTKERKPLLANFYKQIFEITGIPNKIVDYGCGMNLLTYPWMVEAVNSMREGNLGNDINRVQEVNEKFIYEGYDVDIEVMDFLNKCCQIAKLDKLVTAKVGDILIDKLPRADIYFLLKVVSLLEHQKKDVTIDVLEHIPAKYIVVSFPTKSLTGKSRGMEDCYRESFVSRVEGKFNIVGELVFENELVFVLSEG